VALTLACDSGLYANGHFVASAFHAEAGSQVVGRDPRSAHLLPQDGST